MLRNWFGVHISRTYPAETNKQFRYKQTGCQPSLPILLTSLTDTGSTKVAESVTSTETEQPRDYLILHFALYRVNQIWGLYQKSFTNLV